MWSIRRRAVWELRRGWCWTWWQTWLRTLLSSLARRSKSQLKSKPRSTLLLGETASTSISTQVEAPDGGWAEGEKPWVGMFQEEEWGLEGDVGLPESKSHVYHPGWPGWKGREEGVVQEVGKEAILQEQQLQGLLWWEEEERRKRKVRRGESEENPWTTSQPQERRIGPSSLLQESLLAWPRHAVRHCCEMWLDLLL